MLKKIKEAIKKNDRLYALARCIKNINDPEYIKLVRGYYEQQYYDAASILVHHYGDREPNKLIVGICNDTCYSGFCAMLLEVMSCLNCADIMGATPSVLWSTKTLYYEPGLEKETDNVFEYYFKPISDIKYSSIYAYKNVIKLHRSNDFCRDKAYENDGWFYSDNILKRSAFLYKKYIQLNDRTNGYISEQILNLVGEPRKVIGVHVRGTDYGIGLKGHPVKIQPAEHIKKVKELLISGKYDKVFLATDDLNAIEQFKKEFSDKLVYYKDAFRTDNDVGPHSTPSDRPFHHYKLGLEVLRDVYTLANCGVLICGLSNVSLAARYVNLALDRIFDEVIVLNNGINE